MGHMAHRADVEQAIKVFRAMVSLSANGQQTFEAFLELLQFKDDFNQADHREIAAIVVVAEAAKVPGVNVLVPES